MTEDVESLDDIERAADYEVELGLTNGNGEVEQIKCRKLGIGITAQATAFVKKQRRKEYLADAVQSDLNMPQVLQLHAEVLRGISCTNVSTFDAVYDPDGQIKLCELAINRARGKSDQLTFDQVKDRLAHDDRHAFFRKLCILSGIYAPLNKENKPADPCVTHSSTPSGSVNDKSHGSPEC